MSSTRVSLSQSTLQSSNLRRRGNPIWVRPSSLVKLPREAGVAACLNLEVKEPRAPRDVGSGDKSKDVMEAEGKVLVGTYARPPVVLASGRGCKLYDVEGREYLDLSSGIMVNALGYGDPDRVNAVVEQANTLTHVSNVYYSVPQCFHCAGQRSLSLDWATRYDVCLGIARGLAYLHKESRPRIVHRDVKASNLLLESDIRPKISDFGLAKLYDDKKTHISTRVAGTIGYLVAEYAMRGHLTEKADVFVFGVVDVTVALEVVSGRPNSDRSLEEEKIYLLEWAWNLHETNRIVELVDSRLTEFNEEEAKRMVAIALLCTQTSPALRPPKFRVVAMLSGDIEVPTVSMRPGYLADWRFSDTSSFLTETADNRSPYNSPFTASTVGAANLSPEIATTPMLDEIISEGR